VDIPDPGGMMMVRPPLIRTALVVPPSTAKEL
jgi:hypothetical protein